MSLFFAGSILWLLVYVVAIRGVFKARKYAIPYLALILNFTWEIFHGFFYMVHGVFSTPVLIAFAWSILDAVILASFVKSTEQNWKKLIVIPVMVICLIILNLGRINVGATVTSIYSALLINLLMSIEFVVYYSKNVHMLFSRFIAVLKFPATSLICVYFFIKDTANLGAFALGVGFMCSVLDVFYIFRIYKFNKFAKAQLL